MAKSKFSGVNPCAAICVVISVSGCSQPSNGQVVADGEAAKAVECREFVYTNYQQSRDNEEFDTANDVLPDGIVSCQILTSPSEVQIFITVLSDAIRTGDSSRIASQSGVPVLFINRDGEARSLDEPDLRVAWPEISASLRQKLPELTIQNVKLQRSEGVFFGDGYVWGRVDADTGSVVLKTINLEAAGSDVVHP